MKKILHIIATPRAEQSSTLKVAEKFMQTFKDKYPSYDVDELDLYKEELPKLSVKRIDGKYALLGGADLQGDLQDAWKEIIVHIERFLSADIYLLSVPMWNFNIPYALKHYIDIIVQPKYLFRYTQEGPEGLVKGRKMVVVTSRGGDYSSESPFRPFDFQEPYLRTVFGFVGISDICFINAQPMNALGEEIQREKISQAQDIAVKVATEI